MIMKNLKLTIFHALLGHINKNVRALAYDYCDSKITIQGYLDTEPVDDDYEVMDIVISEIMASYPEIKNQEIKLLRTSQPIGKLCGHKGWVFIRNETDDIRNETDD
ncbi:hypothetical protein JHU04_001105 [Brenneria sp. 4F2]|nr:hypothetical protein [Brenneria bubanii]